MHRLPAPPLPCSPQLGHSASKRGLSVAVPHAGAVGLGEPLHGHPQHPQPPAPTVPSAPWLSWPLHPTAHAETCQLLQSCTGPGLRGVCHGDKA